MHTGRIVQIAAVGGSLFALADDGTIWRCEEHDVFEPEWEKIEPPATYCPPNTGPR